MPAAIDRSVSEVLRDIVGNVQTIVRSEVRLAKTEIREEASKARLAVVLIGGGAVTAIFAALFLLLAGVFALILFVPAWAAALIVGATLAIIAALVLSAGTKRFKQLGTAPHPTAQT